MLKWWLKFILIKFKVRVKKVLVIWMGLYCLFVYLMSGSIWWNDDIFIMYVWCNCMLSVEMLILKKFKKCVKVYEKWVF